MWRRHGNQWDGEEDRPTKIPKTKCRPGFGQPEQQHISHKLSFFFFTFWSIFFASFIDAFEESASEYIVPFALNILLLCLVGGLCWLLSGGRKSCSQTRTRENYRLLSIRKMNLIGPDSFFFRHRQVVCVWADLMCVSLYASVTE